MKKIMLTYLLSTISMLSCISQKNTNVSYSRNDDGNIRTYTYNNDEVRIEIKYTGDIYFNESETAVQSVSANGYLRYNKDGNKIYISPGDNGTVFYEINGGDKKTSLDASESAFLAAAIKTLIEHGVGAKDRVARIYKKDGTAAVLKEVVNLKADYVKGIYMNYLLETNTLSKADMIDIANKVATIMESDFEKRKLLSDFSKKYLSDEATTLAYLKAVKTIGSDFEKSNATKHILSEPLTAAQFTEVLSLTQNIGSDFEKSNVLKEVLANNKISTAQFSEVLKATATIGSDFAKASVLREIFDNNTISAGQFSEVIKTIATIGSDFEKANIIKNVLDNNKLPESQFNEMLDAISEIGSDFEKANVLKQVARQKIINESQWLNLISKTEKLSSDFEKSNVLIEIASHMPIAEKVKAAYMKTAKTISSDHEYGRVMRVLKENDNQ